MRKYYLTVNFDKHQGDEDVMIEPHIVCEQQQNNEEEDEESLRVLTT